MNSSNLYNNIKPIGTMYMYWFLFGVHYAYFGKWGTQLLYWITLGGLGVWAFRDFVRMPEMVINHRESAFRQNDELEKEKRVGKHYQIRLKPISKYKLAMVS